jgi:ATP-binding cassette subfamily B (MDR/TAP) protein 1
MQSKVEGRRRQLEILAQAMRSLARAAMLPRKRSVQIPARDRVALQLAWPVPTLTDHARFRYHQSRIGTTFSYIHLLFSVNPEKGDILLLLVGTVCAIAAGIPFPLLGLLFGQLVDDLNSNSCSTSSTGASTASTEASVRQKVLYVIYISIANFALTYLHSGAWSLFGERLVRRLRRSYLSSLLRQEVGYFETLPVGEVAARLDGDLHAIQSGVSEKVGIVLASISYFVAAFVVALTQDARLAGMLFSLVPAYFLMAFGGGHFTKKYVSAVTEQVTLANAIASESLSQIRLVKAFGAAARVERIFVDRLTATRRAAIGKILTAATQMGLLYFIAYSANALAISQGGRQIADSIAAGESNVTVGNVYTVIFVMVDGKLS